MNKPERWFSILVRKPALPPAPKLNRSHHAQWRNTPRHYKPRR